ncbi:MAG: hypothetical protein QXP49_06245, partial [Nitrososphaerota archaeon]
FPPRTGRVIEIEKGANHRILTEHHDGPIFQDYDQYADLLIYGVLWYLRRGDRDGALKLYDKVLVMWD